LRADKYSAPGKEETCQIDTGILDSQRLEADMSQHPTCFGYLSRNVAAPELIYTSGVENEIYDFVAEEFE
jgi:hypothetical protein